MSEMVELKHACGAAAGAIERAKTTDFINAGFHVKVPGLPLPLYEGNSNKPCLTCPRTVKAAAQLGIEGLMEVYDEVPEGCYYERQLYLNEQTS